MQRQLSRLTLAQRALAAATLAATLAFTPSAHADARSEARQHFSKGMALLSDGKYEEGIAELTRAYDILPHPSVLYNIARANAEAGNLQSALDDYKEYLESNPADRDEVQSLVSNLEGRLRQQALAAAAANQPAAPAPPPTPGAAPPNGPALGEGQAPSAGGEPASSALPTGNVEAPPVTAPNPAGVGVGSARTEDVFAETVVTASKGAQSPLDAPNSTSVITEQDIRLSGITQIPELLRRLAGVDIMEVTAGQPEVSIRGFNQRLSNKVLVLVDGRSTTVDLLGNTFWATLTVGVEDIQRIEVVRGPGSSLYGADAFNGVINIITRSPGDGRSGFTAGVGDRGDTHEALWASGREKLFNWRMSAGYDYRKVWSRQVGDGRADVRSATGDADTAQRGMRLDLRLSSDLGNGVTAVVGGGLVRGAEDFEGAGALTNMKFQDEQASDVTAYLTSKHVEARVFWNNTQTPLASLNDVYLGQTLLPMIARTDVVDGEVQYKAKFATGEGIDHDLRVGLGYRLKSVSWTYQDFARTENHESAYLHDEVKLGARIALVGDYRLDYVPYLERLVQSPKGSVLVHPTKRSTIRGIVATAFRSPTFLESYINLPVQLPVAGGAYLAQGQRQDDPSFKLRPEQVLTAELGYLNQDSDFVTVDSAFFYDHTKDLIELSPGRPTSVGDLQAGIGQYDPASGLYPLFYGGFQNQCQSYDVFGAELGLRTAPVEGLDLYANYTLMGVNVDTSRCTTEQRALTSPDARTSASKVNAGVQVRSKIGIDGSVDFHFVGDQLWSEQVSDIVSQRVEYQSFHLDAYTLLNARIGYRFPGGHAEVSAMAFNLLGIEHREHPFGQLIGRRSMGSFTYRF